MTAFLIALSRLFPLVWVGFPISKQARAVVALILAMAVAPALRPPATGLPLLVVREIGIGLCLGLAVSVVFRAAEAAGATLDGVPMFRRGYRWLALAIFAAAGGLPLWVKGITDAYAAVPLGGSLAGGARVVIEVVARLIAAAVELGAPLLGGLAGADLAVALVARAWPTFVDRADARLASNVASLAVLALASTTTGALLLGSSRDLGRALVATARAIGG